MHKIGQNRNIYKIRVHLLAKERGDGVRCMYQSKHENNYRANSEKEIEI